MEKMKKALNKAGILQLADDLVAHPKLYAQHTFGQKEACGTIRCLAGQCLASEIGMRKYNKLVQKFWSCEEDYVGEFTNSCIASGKKQLGITTTKPYPTIFDTINEWPLDLQKEYYEATTPKQHVIVALKALQRLRPNGTIDNKDVVHTEIPQLASLKEGK